MQYDTSVGAVNSQDFWKRPYRVTAASDPDEATAQTVGIMCGHIRNGAADRMVQQCAEQSAQQFESIGMAGNNEADLASAAWWWCKVYIKFVHHEFILRQRLGESGHLQGLIAPEVLVRMDKPEGDCAIFTECLCAFLRVFGIPYEIVTVACNPQEPSVFSHVYLYAVLPDGTRFPLDASHGQYPGWQVPSAHVTRRQVWNADGNPVEDRGSRFDGLHNYGMRGLGDVCSPMDPDFDLAACEASVASFPTACTCLPSGICAEDGNSCSYGGAAPPGSITIPSQSSSAWPAVSAQLAKMGFTLLQQQNLKPGMVIRPDGTILQQNPGYSVPVPFGTQLANTFGAGGSSSLMILGVVAVGAILLMGRK